MRFLPSTRFFRLKSILLRGCGFKIGNNVRFCSSVKILSSQIKLIVGENTFIGHETIFTGGESKIIIGSNCDISTRILFVTGSHKLNLKGKQIAGEGFSKDIIIGDGVWIGANTTILGDINIGNMSVIAAGSLVNKDIPPYCIAGGVPCKPIKFWNKEKEVWERA